ncbi:unnamed protein product [Schistocephalus solidus]|uniref:Rho-GAP domain-containing protein n=1 Tax=Schistocephalus solidus TaxID=70667 RepID=A0A183T9L3_SCHSO|nr:unnamed protein product [Schistocephalus solidus]
MRQAHFGSGGRQLGRLVRMQLSDSLMRGWELLCLCLYFFPPNNVFRDPLRAYLAARCEALSIAEACAVSSGSGNVSACASETGTTNSDRLSAAGQPVRPGPSLAAAAALAAGSDPALISATSITPIFGVPVSVLGKAVIGGSGGNGTNISATSAPGTTSGAAGGAAESVFYVDHSSGTPECQLICPSATAADFPYGPWVKLSALHFTRAAPRWFMRSIAVSCSRPQASISNAELLHVKTAKPVAPTPLLPIIASLRGVIVAFLRTGVSVECRAPSSTQFSRGHLWFLRSVSAVVWATLSTDLDTFTTVRFQLEKLFEVFRMVHVIPKDTGDRSSTMSSQSSNESPVAPGYYTILRPPPAGWSRSQLIFAPEGALEAEGGEAGRRAAPTYPLLLPCSKLTGSFSLPLKPTPIPDRPSEYMLLTPRAAWPADLAGSIQAEVPPPPPTGADGANCPLDPHLAAGLLKLWIRELATPLIPPSLMAEVLAAATEAEAFELRAGAPSSPAVKNNAGSGGGGGGGGYHLDGKPVTPIHACCALVRRLPPLSRRCLLYLIKLLQFLARSENSSVSLMDARNLATVIAPNLFRSSSTNASELLNSVQSQTAFVRLLIAYLDIDVEADLLNAEPDADPVRLRFRSPPRARINADGILIPFR